MLAMEEILCELNGEEELNEQGLPPGFRFHPTDEELVTFYLASKVFDKLVVSGVHIAQIDLNRCEPWDLPDVAKMGEGEWYLYSLRDRKYPTGQRTNRATGSGYWKATGKDREVYTSTGSVLVGMKKTLVFYKGRAPRGEKTKWVMHEYRLHMPPHACACAKEEWVLCRVFHKNYKEKKNHHHPSLLFPCGQANYLRAFETMTQIECTQSKAAIMQAAFHNPYQIHQPNENDLNSFVSSVVSKSKLFSSSQLPSQKQHQSSYSNKPSNANANANNMYTSSPPPSLLPSILFSHQDSTVLKQQQFKAEEASFTANFEPVEANSNFMDIKMQPNLPPYNHHHHQHQHQHPLFFEMECTSPPPGPADLSVHDISTSFAFNTTPHYHTMLDPQINTVHAPHGQSWPLDP